MIKLGLSIFGDEKEDDDDDMPALDEAGEAGAQEEENKMEEVD